MKGAKRRRASSADLPALAKALVAEPRAKANNLPVLLAALTPECSQAGAVLHSLRLFFIDSFDRSDLSVKPPPADDQSPEAVYATWLHRQYRVYTTALLRMLGAPTADARMQVACFVALMECVRGERPGVFNNRLFHRLLEVLLCSAGSAPEVLGLLMAKFLELADVRYFTLASMIKIAQRAQQTQHDTAGKAGADGAAGGSAAGAASEDEEEGSGEESGKESGEEGEGKAAVEGSGRVSPADLARTLHDILAGMSPMPPGLGGGTAGTGGAHGGDGDDEDEEEVEEGGLRSWCGAAEVGIVAAANAGEGARQRKRQRQLHGQQQQQQQAGGQQGGEQQRARWANAKAQQRMYSDAWLALLRMDFPEDVLKKVLARMHDLIIPSLVNPLLLADFLTATLDKGGMSGMLALNGIFVLVTQHGLEYPHFYARLYQLLTPEAFQARHRSRFFALADAFLASGMVPAYTAAAFVKRLARLALAAPPAGAMLALAFMHNIVRRHPATMQLLHRPPRGGLAGLAAAGGAVAAPAAPAPALLLPLPPQVAAQQAALPPQQQADGAAVNGTAAGGQQQGQQQQQGPAWQGVDVFDYAEPDPGKSRALESSLWELEALRIHHNPQVAAYCAILEKDLRDRKKTSEVDISELLTASYASMFDHESNRRLKAVPTAFYRTPPERLFEGAAVGADWAGWALA